MDSHIIFGITVKKVNSTFTLYTEKNKSVSRSDRHCWAIILKYEGETVYSSGGKEYLSNMENIIILPKGSSYEWKCTESGRYYTIEFECDTACDTIFGFPIDSGEKILQLYRDTEYKMSLKKEIYKLEILRNIYSILLLIMQERQEKYLPSSKQQKISPAVDYILNNYNRQIKNDELAALSGLSTIYFRKLFTELFGTPPLTYVHKLRIKKAKEMLKSDYDTLTDIAFTLGYPNIYDFSRTFKKHTGISPTEYRKKYMQNSRKSQV